MMPTKPDLSNVRMCAAIGAHNCTIQPPHTLLETIPAQTSIKALALKALGRTKARTLPAQSKEPVPPISKLCLELGIDPAEVFAQELFDGDDLLLYELGTYSIKQITAYLVSWQVGGCVAPFAIQPEDIIQNYLDQQASRTRTCPRMANKLPKLAL